MTREVKIGNKLVGDGHPAYVIAEIGINHNGDLEIAKRMIDGAVHAGADAVKFQKRTPEVCTPLDQQKQMRETPWGYITYLDYRYKVEFSEEQYRDIDRYCRERKIDWMVSVWDAFGGFHGEVQHSRLQSAFGFPDRSQPVEVCPQDGQAARG